MKVLVAGARFDRSERALLKGLIDEGVQVDVIFDPDAPEYERYQADGIVADGIKFASRVDRSSIKYLSIKVANGGYDIIHSLTNKALSNSILACGGSVKHVAYRGTAGHLSRWDPASWLTYLNPKLDRIICVSDAVREYLLGVRIHESKLKTIYKGHDLDWYSGGANAFPSEFNIPTDAFIVGYTGGMRPVKGVEYLVRSAAELPRGANVHYILFGEGKLEVKLRGLAKSLGVDDIVHFAGFRDDAAMLIGASDVFVMPSIEREGLPRAVIEAMAQGVPAIVSDVGGMPEIVKQNECGLVVEPANPKAIASSVLRFAGDKKLVERFGAASRKRIQSKFNIKTTVDRTLALYEEMMR